MTALLKCSDCGSPHKARSDKFPMDLRKKKPVIGDNGEVTGQKEIVVGHICKRCARKRVRRNPRKVRVI